MPEPDAAHQPPRLYLRIDMDYDGIQWTHFRGPLDFTLTLQELPRKIRKPLRSIVRMLMNMKADRLYFESVLRPPTIVDGERRELPHTLEGDTIKILALTAWYMEYQRRRRMAWMCEHHDGWKCLDCSQLVKKDRDHCSNAQCNSWNKLFHITGEQTLHLVSETETA